MTIKNNSLSDKLNEFKNKSVNQSPLDEKSKEITQKNLLVDFLNPFIELFTFILKSTIFGYSLKFIFKADWNFWAILCIGLSINFVFTYIHQIVHDKK